jgi:hypothetical protein
LVPAIEKPLNVTGVVPTFVTVTDLAALVVPTATAPKLSETGEREICVPVPVKATVCGVVSASSLKVNVPLRIPIAVGLKVTLTVQFAPAATVVPQVLALMAKSPLIVILLIFSVLVPVFVSLIAFAVLVVASTLFPKARFVADSATAGVLPPLPQFGNLKFAMRVFQLKLPVALMYSCVYQKVQSSTGSTVRAL